MMEGGEVFIIKNEKKKNEIQTQMSHLRVLQTKVSAAYFGVFFLCYRVVCKGRRKENFANSDKRSYNFVRISDSEN